MRNHFQTVIVPLDGSSLECIVANGRASEAICDLARQCDAPPVVMTPHGRTGLNRVWLGSVTDAVLLPPPSAPLGCPAFPAMVERPSIARSALPRL